MHHQRRPLAFFRPASLRGGLAACLAALFFTILAGCPFESSRNSGNEPGETPTESTFSKSYGGPGYDAATAVVASADGGFLIVGQTSATNELQPDGTDGLRGDVWLSKLDANGNVEVERVIGELPVAGTSPTLFARARPTPDGGTVLVGVTYSETSGRSEPVEPSDIAVTKLDAQGNVEWTRSYDSGPWLNYEYFVTQRHTAAPNDRGSDIWPLADGGYIVGGVSTANLEDRLGIGFPCPLLPDAVEEEGDDPCQSFPPGQAGNRFVNALSVVVMRLSADGSMRWVRRLTEEAFRLDNSDPLRNIDVEPIVRGTHDGGAFVARSLLGKALFHRLQGDGSPLPLTVIPNHFTLTDAQQTDDPGPNGQRDGLRNDGFVASGSVGTCCGFPSRILKFAADGSLQWSEELGDASLFDDGRDVSVLAVHQRCDSTGAPCVFAAAGTQKVESEPRSTAYLAFVDDSGDTLHELVGAAGTQFERIQGGENGNPYRLLARNGAQEHLFMTLVSDGSELQSNGPTPGPPPQVDPSRRDRLPLGELTAAGGAVLFDDSEAQRLVHVEVSGTVSSDRVLEGGGVAGESGVAAVEVGPGQFIIAAQTAHPSRVGDAAGWLLRYEVTGTGDRIVWQRRLFVNDAPGRIEAITASGDGGIVAGSRRSNDLRLMKFDGAGTLTWQTPAVAFPSEGGHFHWYEVEAVAGGFVALAVNASGNRTQLVNVDFQGAIRTQREYAHTLTSLATTPDGQLMLVGAASRRGTLVNVVKTDTVGAPQWAKVYAPGGAWGLASGLPRIRRSAGGFLIGLSETGLLTALGPNAAEPLGASNVVLFEIDADGAVRWNRVYGALHEEEMRDLVVRDDGVILVAGSSDSFGENSEAWLMKLGPDGMVAAGCNAHLGDIPVPTIAVADFMPEERSFEVFNAPSEAIELTTGGLPLRAGMGFTTARQCAGSANPPAGDPPAGAQSRLTVSQIGDQRGVVISTPAGIACGTGLGDGFCSAAFAVGTPIVLRADPDNFTRWTSQCEAGSGGSNLECVVTLNTDRTVEVQFGNDPGATAQLAVSIAGNGTGSVMGPGISCPGDCSESYALGTTVTLRAVPVAGSSVQGWTGCGRVDGDFCVVTMNGSRAVAAVFQPIP